jgi:plasmid maintenance system antidote protein VapI
VTTAPEALRQALVLAGISQAALARETGLTAKHINQIFMGKAPMSVDVAIRLERILPAISAEDLMVAQVRSQVQAMRALRYEDRELSRTPPV